MRYLTIKREKSYTGCLAKARVYVHDELVGDTKINGDMCYKLGELKNGEEKTFQIGDEETKIYVVQDKLSRNLTNEVCYIPAGIENIYLMGEFKFNPFGGNGFRFHGMNDPRVLDNRKKSNKKFFVYIAICFIIGIVGGVFLANDSADYAKDGKPTEFVDDSGVKITLTDAFIDTNISGFNFTYGCDDVAVLGFADEFIVMDGLEDYTIDEYGELSIANNNLNSEVKKENGVIYYEYDSYVAEDAVTYCYLSAMYKAEEAFWTITFAVDEAQYEEYKPLFLEWANSVEFVEE